MRKELLSITDENSILITAEFLEEGKRLKIATEDIQTFDLDLIVRKDITCNQLLQAIGMGIRHKLLSEFNFDVHKDDFGFLYEDSRDLKSENELSISAEEEIDFLNMQTKIKVPFLQYHRIKRQDKQLAAKEKAIDDYISLQEENDEPEIVETLSETEEKAKQKENRRYGYAVCWKIYEFCYRAYNEGYTDARQPVIGIGSLDYKKIKETARLSESDRFEILLHKEDGDNTLEDMGFINSTRLVFDRAGWHQSAPLIAYDVNPAFKKTAPLYNVSEQPWRKLDDEEVHVITPSEPPQKNKQSMLTAILSPLLMTGSMIGVRLLMGGSGFGTMNMVAMSGCMGVTTIIVAIVNRNVRKFEYKRDIKDWKQQYEQYIQRLLTEIQEKQRDDVEKMEILYPPARTSAESGNNLVSKILYLDGSIYGRGKEHPDFLKIRLGKSTKESQLVPSIFQIEGEKQEKVYSAITYHNIKNIPEYPFSIYLPEDKNTNAWDATAGYLNELPYDIAKQYSFLSGAPVLLDLKKCGTLGIVFEKGYDFQPFLSNIILDLCYHHSPDDLQCVLFCQKNMDWQGRQEIISRFRHLPHFRELFSDISSFAFEKDDAYLIFNKLLEILTERGQNKNDNKYPHIVVVLQEEYEIKKHLISEYLPVYGQDEKDDLGISFIFCKRYLEELPKYCGQVIKREKSEGKKDKWFLLPHSQSINREDDAANINLNRYGFEPDEFAPSGNDQGNERHQSNYYRAFKTLSSLYYLRIAQGNDVPSSVDLFEIIGHVTSDEKDKIEHELKEYISSNWRSGYWQLEGENSEKRKKDVTESLAVPIGKKAGGVIELDLHEKADGPHMLVAGTTGSGKTETILTYLINLCSIYTPEEVNLLLMDMKGAGFVQRIGDDSPLDEKDKTRLPHVVGTVTDITGDETGTGMAYMLKRFLQSMTAEVKRRKLQLNIMGVDSVDEYTKAKKDPKKFLESHKKLSENQIKEMPFLPHLFVVIDEFTELMRFSSDNGDVDFKSEITSLARIGRSLGFHIILISQNIENAITPDIRVNSRARLCLKVATRDASRDMIGTDLAASPQMPGNGRAYLLVGTGSRFEYFQSGYSGADISRNMDQPVVVTQASFSGKYSLFYDSDETEKEVEEGLLELSSKKLAESVASITNSILPDNEDSIKKLDSEAETTDEESVYSGEDKASTDIDYVSDLNQSESLYENGQESKNAEFNHRTDQSNIEDDLDQLRKEIDYVDEKHGIVNSAFNDVEVKDKEGNAIINPKNKSGKTGITQLKVLVSQIRACYKEGNYEAPHCVFQEPLPTACYYEYDWDSQNGQIIKLKL